MKLITLNIWGGHVHDPLLAFIAANQDIDIFCFQEVYHNAHRIISTEDRMHYVNIFSEIGSHLPQHQGYFRPVVEGIYGIATFIKTSIDVLGEGEVVIHDNAAYPGFGPTHSRNLQWIECNINSKIMTLLNVHGLWNGAGKTDSPARISQSQRIRDFVDTLNTPKILCGDFNLRPDTESIRILENGMNNLVNQFNVTSTRTNLYQKTEKFADYIFTSPDINIHKFEVLQDEVSDHTPLFLEFDK